MAMRSRKRPSDSSGGLHRTRKSLARRRAQSHPRKRPRLEYPQAQRTTTKRLHLGPPKTLASQICIARSGDDRPRSLPESAPEGQPTTRNDSRHIAVPTSNHIAARPGSDLDLPFLSPLHAGPQILVLRAGAPRTHRRDTPRGTRKRSGKRRTSCPCLSCCPCLSRISIARTTGGAAARATDKEYQRSEGAPPTPWLENSCGQHHA